MKTFYIKTRNAIHRFLYTKFLRPILFKMDPEFVHDLFLLIGRILNFFTITRWATWLKYGYSNKMLEQKIAGIKFKNPVGLAAGFDKNARIINLMSSVGFGHTEVGSITAKPCSGNPKPRIWRHTDKKALRVYYGLVNDGVEKIAAHLTKQRNKRKFNLPLGISIAKTNCRATADTKVAIADYVKSFKELHKLSDYMTINISCPNAYGGVPFTDHARLDKLLRALRKVKTSKPIFLKMSPDINDKALDEAIALAKKYKLAGFVCTNLSKKFIKEGPGGMSGKAVEKASNEMIRKIYKKTHDPTTSKSPFTIIGVGGIFSAQDAYKKIRLGASLLQLITGMIYEGPQLIGEINRGLVVLLKRDGFKNISEAVGIDA